jgi:uncharacterized membrane protein
VVPVGLLCLVFCYCPKIISFFIRRRLKYVNFRLMLSFVRVVGLIAREVFLSVLSTTGSDKVFHEQHVVVDY